MKHFDPDAAAYASTMQIGAADANLIVHTTPHTVRSLDVPEADPAAAPLHPFPISSCIQEREMGNGWSGGHGRHGGRGRLRERKRETISLCSLDPDPAPFGS